MCAPLAFNSIKYLHVLCTVVFTEYDDNINVDIANSFATAAMRFGHTQIQGMMTGRDSKYNVITNIPLSTVSIQTLKDTARRPDRLRLVSTHLN